MQHNHRAPVTPTGGEKKERKNLMNFNHPILALL